MKPPDDLERFYASEYRRVVSALVLYLGDRQTAEDVAHDAFVRVCRDWEKVRSLHAPGVWLHRVAMNLATSWFRRRAAERRANERAVTPIPPHDVGDRVDLTDREEIRRLLMTLPFQDRSVLVLRYFTGLSVRETAEVLGRPEGTVKTWTHRALIELRRAGVVETEVNDRG
jgi:RNA polymerase sigma factor (sigma-70 family)